VKDIEVEALKRAIAQIDNNYDPAYVFYSINKDTNMKFYRQENGRIDNPLPGTVLYD
jgi:hypothetical protein